MYRINKNDFPSITISDLKYEEDYWGIYDSFKKSWASVDSTNGFGYRK